MERRRQNLIVNALLDITDELKEAADKINEEDDLHVDHLLKDSLEHLSACRSYVTLYRTPVIKRYDPSAVLREVSGQEGPAEPEFPPRSEFLPKGDARQIKECLKTLFNNVSMGPQGAMYFTLVSSGADSHFALGFPPGGTFLDPMLLEGRIEVSHADLTSCWTAASDGGPVVWRDNGVELFLSGQAQIEAASGEFGAVADSLNQAIVKLQPWRGAIGTHDPGYASHDEAKKLYIETIGLVQGRINEAMDGLV